MSLRNFRRATFFGVIIAAMCLVSMFTLAYIAQFVNPETLHNLMPPIDPMVCSLGGWAFLVGVAWLFARKIVRTVVG